MNFFNDLKFALLFIIIEFLFVLKRTIYKIYQSILSILFNQNAKIQDFKVSFNK